MNYRLRYIIFTLLAILVSMHSFAQVNVITVNRQYDHEIGFDLDMNTSSTLNNALLNASGFIDDDLKDENRDRLGELNQAGTNVDLRFYYRQDRPELWGIKKLGFYVAMEWHYLDEYRFTQDVYSLILYGNKDFAGQEANLSNTGRQSLNYYQFKLGLQKISKNNRHYFGINAALNLGNQLFSFEFNDKSGFYTSPLGNEVYFRSNTDYLEQDTAAPYWYQISGIGASVDLFYKYKVAGKYSIAVSVENIGYIHWNKNTLSFNENKIHSFSGVEVDNIFDIPNPLIQSSDTLRDYIYENTTQGTENTIIPIDMKLRYQQYFLSNSIEMVALIHYRMHSYMLPLYQIDATYRINEYIKLGPIISYGGYTTFNAGLKMEFNFAKYYQIRLESRYLTGFAQHSFSGMGGFINFTYKI